MRKQVRLLAREIRECTDEIEHNHWQHNAFDRLLNAVGQLNDWHVDFVGKRAEWPSSEGYKIVKIKEGG